MGNTRSEPAVDELVIDPWWHPQQHTITIQENDNSEKNRSPIKRNDDKLDDFKQELIRKRERRRQLIAERRHEIYELREQMSKQKQENENLHSLLEMDNMELVKENEELKRKISELKKANVIDSEILSEKNKDLQCSVAKLQGELQAVNAEVICFEKERFEYQAHVTALKDVIRVSKQMLLIRDHQLTELKQKITEIEAAVTGKEINVLSEDLKREYEKQLRNIRSLRTLYEERQRAERKEKEKLESQLDDVRKDLESSEAKKVELEERIVSLETENSKKYDHITALESNLGLVKAECRQLQAEMAVINQLFSHILLGFSNGPEIDLDKLIKLLEENHDLLQDIVINEESGASSALAKMLLDLVNQINDKKETILEKETIDSQPITSNLLNSPTEIVKNLPKVWKVLIELLSQQNPPVNVLIEQDENENPCYKLVQTPKGPKLVLSVSQTFIRLKDLILEKKSLEKETTRLKQLNSHLEVRLQDQEKRLELVCTELSKTWHVVGKMQKQHNHLHTQEKILRYELAQKRKLLTELKEELEYCREKWVLAREKNSTTEAQWKELRGEFASRKRMVGDDFNNSLESGYSDERESSSTDEEEPGYETDISDSQNKFLFSSEIPVSEDTDTQRDLLDITELNEITEIENEQSTCTSTVQEQNTNVSQINTNGESDRVETNTVTAEDIVSARDERLKRLEEETKQLMSKVSKTTLKSWQLDVKLENLHEKYGENSSSTQNEQGQSSAEDKESDTVN